MHAADRSPAMCYLGSLGIDGALTTGITAPFSTEHGCLASPTGTRLRSVSRLYYSAGAAA